MPVSVRTLLTGLVLFGVLILVPRGAAAGQFTFAPSPTDLNDLDHHMMYTWRVDGVNLAGGSITGAQLTITNISNWDTNPAQLFIHLLDTAVNPGVASYVDAAGTPVTTISDNFVVGQAGYSNLVGSSSVGNTFLTAPTAYFPSPATNALSMTPTTFTYNLTTAQYGALAAYIASGSNFALAFDPDCHFFNDGISFTIFTGPSTTSVPEPASLTLLGLGIASAAARRRRLARGA